MLGWQQQAQPIACHQDSRGAAYLFWERLFSVSSLLQTISSSPVASAIGINSWPLVWIRKRSTLPHIFCELLRDNYSLSEYTKCNDLKGISTLNWQRDLGNRDLNISMLRRFSRSMQALHLFPQKNTENVSATKFQAKHLDIFFHRCLGKIATEKGESYWSVRPWKD